MSLLMASWTPWRISRRYLMIHRSGGIGPHREGKAKPFESHFRGRKGEVCIVDTTLRDGEQTAGVVFATREKVRIARLISEVGVREMEVGTPWLCPEEREAITEICALGLESRTLAFCQAEPSEIELAAATGVDAVVISAGFSADEVGLARQLVVGKHSGSRTIQHKFREFGIDLSDKEANQVLLEARQMSVDFKRSLFDKELMYIYQDFIQRDERRKEVDKVGVMDEDDD